MSEEVDVGKRIREIRRKVMKAFLDIPAAIANAIVPETPQVSSFYGRNMLTPFAHDVSICISENGRDCPDLISVSPYQPPTVIDFDRFEYLAKLSLQREVYAIPARVTANGEVKYIALEPMDVTLVKIRPQSEEDVLAAFYPPGYPPKSNTPELVLQGTVYACTDASKCGGFVAIVIGSAGYESTSGYVFWNAVGALAITPWDETVYFDLPCCRIGTISQNNIRQAQVNASVFSVTLAKIYLTEWR